MDGPKLTVTIQCEDVEAPCELHTLLAWCVWMARANGGLLLGIMALTVRETSRRHGAVA